jgi:hypothetical protein
MAEPTIKAKLVLDTTGMKGVAAGVGGGVSAKSETFTQGFRRALEGLDFPILGDIGAAVSGMVLILASIGKMLKSFMGFLMKSSGILASSVNLLSKSMQILLRPIGDALGLFIKPFAIAMLRFAIPLYKKWRQFLELESTQEGLGKINEGAGKVGAGLISLDFGMVREGLGEVFGGMKELTSGFISFVGAEAGNVWERLKTFMSDAGAFMSEKFEQLGGWLSKKLSGAFVKFIKSITPDSWNETIEGFGTSLESGIKKVWDIFGTYLSNLGDSWWAGPLAPFVAAVKTAWDEVVGPMIDSLITALDEKIPGLKEALGFLFGSSKEGSEKGFFSKWIEEAKEWDNLIVGAINPLFGVIYTAAEMALGKEKGEKGKTVLGAFNKTIDAMNESVTGANNVTTSLNNIPTQINTTHTITTVYRTEGSPP